VAEPARLLDELLADWVTPLLNKEGFRKTGLSYHKNDVEAIMVIAYQRSVRRGECDTFTVNLGIGSKHLFAFKDKSAPKRMSVERSHWSMRLGRLLENPHDAWWELCTKGDVATIGREQRDLLETKALPALNHMASDEALRRKWLARQAPGLTELQRLLNLSVLLDDPDHRAEQRAVIGELKDLATRKGFGGRVAAHLEELGVD
jgi:hypothetical protein